MPAPHNKIIIDAAKAALGPLNFRRKDTSRTWIADHGWWLAIVEFQPSSWGKGSNLNVAAHWLWTETGCVSFDFGGRVADCVEYQSEAQFAPAAAHLAQVAAQEAKRLAQTFVSLDETADVLLNKERSLPRHTHGDWMSYHAGVAAGLVERAADAAEMFDRVLDSAGPMRSILHNSAECMAQLATEPFKFRCKAVSLIERQRNALKLPFLPALMSAMGRKLPLAIRRYRC